MIEKKISIWLNKNKLWQGQIEENEIVVSAIINPDFDKITEWAVERGFTKMAFAVQADSTMRKYRVKDLQAEGRYFGTGLFTGKTFFESKKEACKWLLRYYSLDLDVYNAEVEQNLFDSGNIDECWNALAVNGWELEEV